MRPDRLRLRVIAAWLGVLALGLDALVPVHLAFDLARAAAPAQHHQHGANRNFIAALLTLVTGHRDAGGAGDAPDKDHHHNTCAVCGAVAALAGLTPAAAVPPLAAPPYLGAVVQSATAAEAPRAPTLAAYRSRAPPLA